MIKYPTDSNANGNIREIRGKNSVIYLSQDIGQGQKLCAYYHHSV
jgi:hypothetical protein